MAEIMKEVISFQKKVMRLDDCINMARECSTNPSKLSILAYPLAKLLTKEYEGIFISLLIPAKYNRAAYEYEVLKELAETNPELKYYFFFKMNDFFGGIPANSKNKPDSLIYDYFSDSFRPASLEEFIISATNSSHDNLLKSERNTKKL